jgi:peptide/nickel transport system permease protein
MNGNRAMPEKSTDLNNNSELKKSSLLKGIWYRLNKNKLAMMGLYFIIFLVIIAIIGPWISPYGFDDQNAGKVLQSPTKEFPFGTDNFGRDILSRMIYGSRVTFQVGIVAVVFSATFGCGLGAIAAFYQKTDDVIMRVIDIVAGIPYLLLAIVIAAALGSGLTNLMIAVGISAIPSYARVTRAAFLTVKETEYIEAAHSIGASDLRIILLHILPNALSPIIVQATLGAANAIILAAVLSFMGLGIQPPSPEWGAMLSSGRIYIRDYWHMTVIPGFALMLVVYALNTLGDGLRDALDPRLKN